MTRTSDGSDSNTQTLINASANGDIVVVPNGTFTWNTGISVNKAIKVMGQTIGSCNIVWNNNTAASMITLTPQASGIVECCNFVISATAAVNSHSGHFVYVPYASGASAPPTTKPVCLHDCTFNSTSNVLSMVLWSQNGGVIWNCTFNENNTGTQTTNYDETVQFKNPSVDTWAYPSTMGLAGDPNGTYNTYLEDCTFNKCYTNCTDNDDGSRTVIRYCTWNESCAASHGFDTSPLGNRHWEFYGNHFVYPYATNDPNATNVNAWIIMRGGTGVITNNTFQPQASQNWGSGRKSVTWLSDSVTQGATNRCYYTYPIPRAVGQGWNGGSGTYTEVNAWPPPLPGQIAWATLTGYFTDPVYVWNNHTDNTYQGGNADTQGWIDNTGCPGGYTSAQFIVSGQDFFWDGTGNPNNGAKPGWAPYTYPHPIRAQLAGPSHPYTTNFPLTENPISEGNVWLNGQTDGTVWTNVRTTGGSPGKAYGTMPGNAGGNAQYADSTCVLIGTWGPTQSAQGTIVLNGQSNAGGVFEEVEVRLRTTITANSITGYEFNCSCNSSDPYIQIVRWNGPLGSFTLLDSRTGPGGITTGTILGATANGNVLSIYINGVFQFSVTDSTYPTGSMGMGFFLQGATGINATYGFSSFTASDGGGSVIEVPISGTSHAQAGSMFTRYITRPLNIRF